MLQTALLYVSKAVCYVFGHDLEARMKLKPDTGWEFYDKCRRCGKEQ